jgi:hypothetical protein
MDEFEKEFLLDEETGDDAAPSDEDLDDEDEEEGADLPAEEESF